MAAKEFVERKIKTNKVVVFSKSYCPYCRRAGHTLKRFKRSALSKVLLMRKHGGIPRRFGELCKGMVRPELSKHKRV